MTNLAVTDSDIFAKLREHVASTTILTQLLVDTTNKAMEDEAFRNTLIERLGVTPAVSTETRPYNLTLANLRKVYSTVRLVGCKS